MYQDAALIAQRRTIEARAVKPSDLKGSTFDDVLEWSTYRVLVELLNRRDGGGLPSLKWAGSYLVRDANACLREWSEAKGLKHADQIKAPTPRQAAEVLMVYRHVILVPAEGEESRGTALMAVWDPVERLYVECSGRSTELTQALRELYFSADDRWLREVLSALYDLAPLRELSIDSDTDLVPLLDCVYNMKTGERLPYTPDMVFFSKVRTRLPLVKPELPRFQNPDGTWWDPQSWLVETVGSEALAWTLKEVLNYLLRNRQFSDDKIIGLMATKGNNGKGTILSAYRGVIGGDKGIGCVSLGMEKYSGESSKYAIAGLLGAMANLSDESVTESQITSSAMLKAVSSHDPITLERKYLHPISVRLFIGQVFSLNKLPRFRDKSEAVDRRLHLIQFPCHFDDSRKNPYIKRDYIKTEAFREWFLWEALMEVGPIIELSKPAEVQDALEIHRGGNDPVIAFWREYSEAIEASCMTKVPLRMLYDAFGAWSKTDRGSGSTVEGISSFTERLVDEVEKEGVWTVARVARGDIKQTSIKGWRGTPSAQAVREIFGHLGKSQVRPPTTYTPHQEVMAGDKKVARWTRGPAHLNEISVEGTTPPRSACLERDSAPAPAATSAPATPTPQAQAQAPAPARAGLAELAAQAGVTVSEVAPIHPVTPVGVAPGWGGEGITPPATV